MTFAGKNAPINTQTWEEKEKLYKIIQEQKELLEDIHSNIDEVVWVCKFDPFEILYTNKACEKIHGYTADEIISDPSLFRNSIHPDDEDKFNTCIADAITTGKSYCEFRIIHKDGSIKVLKTQSTMKKGDGSQPDTLSGIAIDITALRNTENALIEKVDEVETILGSISDAFCTVDENWDFNYVNKAFCELFDMNPETVLNKSLWDCFPKLKNSFFYTGMVSAKEDKKHVHMEGISLSTGKMLSASFYPFKNGIAIYTIDITNETVQRQTIEEQQQQLIDIARFQSHQVRGPVATILGLAQLIDTDEIDSTINKELIEGLIEAAHELDRTIKQIDKKTKCRADKAA